MRYLQSVRSRWLDISQVPFWRIFSLHERRFIYALYFLWPLAPCSPFWSEKNSRILKTDHRKYAFPAWPKRAVIGMGKICRSWALEHSIRTRDQPHLACSRNRTLICMLPNMSVYLKVFSEQTSYSRPQVRSIKENTRGSTFRVYQ